MVACSSTPEATALLPITVPRVPILSFAPLLMADVEGFFAEEGLEVTFEDVATTRTLMPSLIVGDIDVWAGAPTYSLFNAILSGDANLRVVAGKGEFSQGPDGCVDTGFVAGPDAGIGVDAESLRGKTIASRGGGLTGDWSLHRLLEDAGLTMDDIELAGDVSMQATPELIAQGQIDVAYVAEPWITRVADRSIVASSSTLTPDYVSGVVVFGERIIEREPEVGDRFMRAYLRGIEQYNEGKTDRNLELLSEATEMTVEELQDICWVTIPVGGAVPLAALQEAVDWAVSTGAIDAPITTDQWWEPGFLERAS